MLLLLQNSEDILSPITHTTATLAQGFQFTQMVANDVTINFAVHRLGTVSTLNTPTTELTRAVNPWNMEQLFDDSSVIDGYEVYLKTNLRAGLLPGGTQLLDFDIDCVPDNVNGAMVFTPSIEMRSAISATNAFHSCSIEFEVEAPGDADRCLVMLNGTVQEVVPFMTDIPTPSDPSTEYRIAHPGPGDKGGDIVSATNPVNAGIIGYDEPSGNLSANKNGSSQAIYFYNHDTKEGILFRTNDHVGQGKVFHLQRNGNNLIVKVFFVPQDNSVGVNNNSDETPFGYSLEVRPMKGDYYDALRYAATRMEEEGHPAFDKTKIRNDSGFTEKVRNMVCFSATTSDGLGFDYEKMVEQNRRIKNYFGGETNSIVSLWYGTEPFGLNVSAPTYTPMNDNSAAKVAESNAEGIPVLMYILPSSVDEIDFNTRGLDIAADLALTRTSYEFESSPAGEVPIELEHTSVPARIKYVSFSWRNAANNLEYVQYIADQFDSVGISGFYVDVGGYYGPTCNDDPNIDPADRGFGSKTWMPGYLSLSDLLRQEVDATEPIIMHEWPLDLSIKHCDIVTWGSVGPAGTDTVQVWGPAIQFGERIKHSTFGSFGAGATDEFDPFYNIPGIVSKNEYMNAIYLYWFVGGQMMPISAYWSLRDEYFIALEGEDDYDDWFEAAIPHYQFLKSLWWNHQSLVRIFQTSKKLRELPNSSSVLEKIEIRAGFRTAPVADGEFLYLYSGIAYDEDNDVVMVVCGNWTEVGGESNGGLGHTVRWQETLTTADWPELGTSMREVYLLEGTESTPERIADYDGSGTYSIDVEMTPGRVVWLLMGDPTRATVMGQFNPIQTIMGGFPVTIEGQLLTCYQNKDKTFSVQCFDDKGDARDMTGITAATFKVWSEDGTGTLYVTKTLGSGIALGAESNVFDVTLGVLDTTFAAGKWYYQISATDTDTEVVASGRFLMKASS